MSPEEYVCKDGRKLTPAEAALFNGAVNAWQKRQNCRRYAQKGENLYMAIQSAFHDAIMEAGLWETWEDFNNKA